MRIHVSDEKNSSTSSIYCNLKKWKQYGMASYKREQTTRIGKASMEWKKVKSPNYRFQIS